MKDLTEDLEYFLEENVIGREAMKIRQRLQKEQDLTCPPGTRCPIIQVTGENTTPKEREDLSRHYRCLNQKAITSYVSHNTDLESTPNEPIGGAPLPLSIPELVQSIHDILHPNKKKSEVTAYELTNTVLGKVRLVNYEGTLYLQKGMVFCAMDEKELQKMLFLMLESWLASGMNQRILTQVADLLYKNPRLCVSCTTEGPERVFFQNGPYDLEHHCLSPLGPFEFFTSYLPFDYRPEQQECPYFDRFVSAVSGGDPSVWQLIWEVLGYILSFDMSAKAFFVLQGVGDSGKSVFGNLVSSFFNPEALAHLDIYRFKDRFSTSALRGKRLNICMDLPRAKISREAIGTIKMLTGDDTITIEEKFRQSESYKPTCKLLFGSNFPLMPGDNDPAFRARLITIPFRYAVPKEQQDKHLLDKLLAERSAIAVKALDAYLELRRRNYRFPVVHGICDMNGYVAENELMERFVRECCQFRPDGFVFTADLQETYNAFRASCNVPPIMDTSTFSKQFNAFCAGRAKPRRLRRDGRNLNGYVGVALLG